MDFDDLVLYPCLLMQLSRIVDYGKCFFSSFIHNTILAQGRQAFSCKNLEQNNTSKVTKNPILFTAQNPKWPLNRGPKNQVAQIDL